MRMRLLIAIALCAIDVRADVVRSVEPLLGHRIDAAYDAWTASNGGTASVSNGILLVGGRRMVRVDYASYPGAKPVAGPVEVVLRGTENFSGTAKLVLARLGSAEKREFAADGGDGPLRFKTELTGNGRWQFKSVAFDRGKSADPIRLAVTGIDAVVDSSEAEALRFEIDTGDPIHVVRGRQDRVELVFGNPSERKISWCGTCQLQDFFGNSQEIPVDVSVDAGGRHRVPIDVPSGKGVWHVRLSASTADGSACVRHASFAVLDENRVTPLFPDGKFRMGVNYHMGRVFNTSGVLADTLHALGLCGAKLVRVDAGKMSHVQPNGPDEFLWEKSDRMVELLQERGLAFDSIILGIPKWARDTEGKNLQAIGNRANDIPARRGLFRDYCETLARRYGTKIAYYEIGNEVDLRRKEVYTADEYVERIYNEAYEGLKKGCPQAVVMPGGFAKPGGTDAQMNQVGFQERFLELAGSKMDAHPVHGHGGFRTYSEKLRTVFFKNREKFGISAPWYSNESALTSFRGMEPTAAVNVWKKILWAWGNGSRDYIWYNLRGTGWDPKDPEQGYGMISADFYPRATFAAFSALANLVSGLDLEASLIQTDERYVYRFAAEGAEPRRQVIAGWDESAHTGAVIRVRTDASRVWTVDMMGNRSPLVTEGGVVAWRIGNLPTALLSEGATVLEPDEVQLKAALPLVDRFIVPSDANGWIPDEFRLDKPEKVFDLYAANPETVKRAWSGNEDLSATVWMHPWSNSLRVVVKVRDDVHCQPYADKKIFMGDSIQLALALPDVRGFWEIGLARLTDGKPFVHVWLAPQGVDIEAAAARIPLSVSRKGDVTRYDLYLPYEVFGLNDHIVKSRGFRFNLLVNDNDGFGGVDCWTEIKPGIATDKNAAEYPWVRFGTN